MSDVEMVTQRNWEQRRHAEEYAAKVGESKVIRIYGETDAGDPSVSRKAGSSPCAGEPKKRNKRRTARAMKTAGQISLVLSAASGFAGMEFLFPAFLLVAALFYSIYFELRGRCVLWHRTW